MPRASTLLQFPSASTHYSTLATKPDIKSPAPLDTGQNKGMTNCIMAWTAYDQGAGTVNPRALLRASVQHFAQINNYCQNFGLKNITQWSSDIVTVICSIEHGISKDVCNLL
jgi:hypothetical protein